MNLNLIFGLTSRRQSNHLFLAKKNKTKQNKTQHTHGGHRKFVGFVFGSCRPFLENFILLLLLLSGTDRFSFVVEIPPFVIDISVGQVLEGRVLSTGRQHGR